MNRALAVPVLMYHKVGPPLPDWDWSFLGIPAHVFAEHLEALARAGWRTADLGALVDHVAGRTRLPAKTVVLTFDDGYVDNWTVAAPLLERHGFTATVFVNPEFVDPRDIVRPAVRPEDVRADDVRGFMSWAELRAASARGVLSVQSHLVSHTWYPAGDEVVDFHRPGVARYWLDWNADPAGKPFYLRNPAATNIPYGTPVYRHLKAAEGCRAFPPPEEAAALATFVEGEGGAAFFDRADWKPRLEKELAQFRSRHRGGWRMETAAERQARLRHEIEGSRREIEERVGAPVRFLAWPGGGYDDVAMAMAQEHYTATTVSSFDRDRLRVANVPGADARRMARAGCPTIGAGARLMYPGGRYLLRFLEEAGGGAPLARVQRRAYKALLLAGMQLGVVRD